MTTTATESQVIPRFRNDLVTQPVDEAGQRFVDVTDPDSGSTFRFYEVEYAIACAMDGNRDVAGLASWALEELGLETSSNELETVISTLGDLGYLDSQAALVPSGLGVAGGASPVASDTAMAASHVEAAALELGLPGKSAVAPPRPVAPAAEDVDLGTPGAAALAAPTPPLAEPVAESASFAGLLDDEPPTDVPTRARPNRLPTADEPTQVRSDSSGSARLPASDDFGLDGITPPPAEVPMPNLRPVTEPGSDDDGPTNLPPPAPGLEEAEVSVDLSEHLSIDASDLKEAVRQSQVMKAVDVPADLLAELETKEPGGAAPLPVAPVESKPIELPETRAKVSTAASSKASGAVEPPATEAPSKSGVSPVLLVLFLLVLAGGAAVWYFKVYKPKQDEKNAANTVANTARANKVPGTVPNGPANKPVKSAKKDISAKLAEQAAEGAVVALAEDAQVTWIADDGSDVAAGDIVAKLRGVDRLEKKLANVESRKTHYQAKLDKATAKLAKVGPARTPLTKKLTRDIATFKAKVAEKEAAATKLREGAAAFLLAAPVAGKVTQKAKAGAWLKKGAAIAEIAGSSKLVATFDLPDSKTLDEGSSVSVQAGGKTIECLVVAVAGPKATVACPAGSAAAGTTVVLK